MDNNNKDNLQKIKSETVGGIINKQSAQKSILVLSGGGIKGIAHVGALKALEDLNLLKNFDTFGGTSAGALVIAMLVIGYNPEETYKFLLNFDMSKISSISIENFTKYQGFDKGDRFVYVLKRLIMAKNLDPEITLHEIYKRSNKTVVFTTVCWNTANLKYLTHTEYPNMPLYMAVRMSVSIPIYYTPVKFNGDMYLDGACMDNYPIKYFEDQLDKVVGIYLSDDVYVEEDHMNNTNHKNYGIETFVMRLIQIFFKANSYNTKKGYEDYTVNIELGDEYSMVDFGLEPEKKKEMYEVGYKTVVDHKDKFI